MSDTVKLIIEIPKKTVEHIRSDYGHGCKGMYDDDREIIVDAIYNAIPLDDVKAEIAKEENIWYHDCEPENGWKKYDVIRVDTVFEILDNIGKAESEDT